MHRSSSYNKPRSGYKQNKLIAFFLFLFVGLVVINHISDYFVNAPNATAADTTAPVRSNSTPTGELSSSTTSTLISLTSDESATCKYSTTAGTAYGSMTNTFSTTGATAHSTNVTGLSAGRIYHFYVRCQDASANANTTDYDITFVIADTGIVYADSCSVPDVNIAYAYAETGDTLKLPAGTCTNWSSYAGLGVTRAITVEGAGRGQTILEISTSSGSYTSAIMPLFAAATVKSLTIRTATSGNSGTAFSASVNGFRITDVEYISRTTSTAGYFLYASAYGLVDNNIISGGAGGAELIFARGPTNSWQTNSSIGGSDNLFIENNTFTTAGYLTDCNSNTRCVVRYNTVTGAQKIDGHGKASNTPPRGVRHMEVYGNTWNHTASSWAAIELRGGTGMVFDNTAAAGNLILHEYGATATWPNFGNTLQTYPVDDQIGIGKDPKSAASEPMYLWNNIRAGANWPISLGYGNAATLGSVIMADRDYYTTATSFNGTSGVGRGTLAARPTTCTTGVGYWATDQGGNWNTVSGGSNDGALYKCTSTNTWSTFYTPYAYPHPLASGSTGTPPPPPVVNPPPPPVVVPPVVNPPPPPVVVPPPPTPIPTIKPTPTPEPTSGRHPRATLVNHNGTIYFLGASLKYAFPSAAVFLSWGARFQDVVPANSGDIAIPVGPVVEYKIATAVRQPRGTLVNYKGTIYFLGAEVRYPFPSAEVFLSWGSRFEDVVPANSGDIAMPVGPLVQRKR